MPDASDHITLTLGEPWPLDPALVAQRGFGWHTDPGNMLLIVERGVTEQMCTDLSGPADLALIAHGPLVGLMVRFAGGWSDWMETLGWRLPGQGIPEVLLMSNDDEPTDRLLFRVVLVDADTKRVAHMRAFTVSPHFTKMLKREVADRWGSGVTNEEALAYREEWNRRYPTPKHAVKASLARSHGGD